MKARAFAVLTVFLAAACGSTVQGRVTAGGAAQDDQGLGVPGAVQADEQPSTQARANGTAPGGPRPFDTGETTASGTAPAPVRSARAVTAPLDIGLTYIDNSGTQSQLGASDPRTVTAKSVAHGFVRAFNAAGGMRGRKLRAVEYSWNSQSSNWSSDAAAACEKFTVDNQVKVVLDLAFGQIGGFRECLRRRGVFHVTTQDVGDRVSASQVPLHVNPTGMTHNRSYGAVIDRMVATRYLTKSNLTGVILEDCAEINRAWSQTLLPMFRRHGLQTPKEARVDCVTGFTSAGPASAEIGNAILRFRSPPAADRVMFVSSQEAAVVLLFGPQASSQRYYPGYMLSSSAQAMLWPDQPFPDDQLPQIHGAGNAPYVDTIDAKQTKIDQRCLRMIRSAGVTPQNYTDNGQVVFECSAFMLLEAALNRTNGDSAPVNLAAAVASLGTSFAAPGLIDGVSEFSRTKHDGAQLVRPFAYFANCDCVRYNGSAARAPG